MKKSKFDIYFLNLLLAFILIFLSCQNEIKDEFKLKMDEYMDYTLEPGKVQMKYLKDTNRSPFIFKDEGINNDLLVNFYSLSCHIELDSYTSQNISELKLNGNGISMRIKKNSFQTSDIIIKEKPHLINDINKYENKKNCPLIINTIDISNLTLLIEENEPTILYFDENYLKKIKLSYPIEEIAKLISFFTLSFSFNDVSQFNIIIPEIINITISNSTTIFLDQELLIKIEGDKINIIIEQIGNKYPCLLTFQIIAPKKVYTLQRDYINKGFIATSHKNLYYYMEVFEEEGEIILNNKRNSGKLFGLIKNKDGINPYNINEYIQNEKDNKLEFNVHTQKLSFNYEHTKNCKKGCYLFLTYYNENNKSQKPIIGYEYTLLVRIWDVDDYSPQIINIPFNEYIFGTFEDNSFINHYYSIFIPKGIQEITIQMESKFIEGFFGEGKKKLITFKKNLNNLNLTDNKMIIKFTKDELKDYIGKEMSLAFRSRNFFENIFSFYYFRILILKENDTNLIYPLDTNIENICLPEKDKNKENSYYCYVLLSNNYREFYLDFSVSTSNQNDNYNISLYKDYIEEEKIDKKYFKTDIYYYYHKLNLILFKFEFEDDKPKIILSSYSNDKDLDYSQIYSPQIYSSQIYRLFNTSKVFNFNLNNGNCFLIFKHIYGRGIIAFDNYLSIDINENYFGKSITIPFSEVKNINFQSRYKEDFIFYIKLEYVNQQLEMKEIIYGESKNEILLNAKFPIYYYIDYNNQDNIDINFRIINIEDTNTTTDIIINGYILNQTTFKRRLNGDFSELKDSIIGKYDKISKNGILQINEAHVNKYFKNIEGDNKNNIKKYILIEINGKNYINCSLSVEIITMSKNNGNYLIPVNQYIIGYRTFNNINYLIKNYTDNNTDIIIEFSPNYQDIKLNFSKSTKILTYKEDIINGIQKYRINTNNKEIILNIAKPEGILDGNYLFRYYYLKNNDEFEYKLDQYSYIKRKIKDEDSKADICLEFNKFEIYHNKTLISYDISNIKGNEINNEIKNGIRLKIYGFLYKKENINNEMLNTSAFISSEFSYENNTEINYSDNNKFEICFNNIYKKDFIYDMQIKINIAFNKKFFKEDSIVYTLPVDFTEEFKKNQNDNINSSSNNTFFIFLIIIIILILLVFIFLYFKQKKKTKILEELTNSSSISLNSIDEEKLRENSKEKISDPLLPFV